MDKKNQQVSNLIKSKKNALMLCTHARGGMRSVIEAYERDGVFQAWHFQSLWTHCEGGFVKKLSMVLQSYFSLLKKLIGKKLSFMHVHVAMYGSFWRKSFFIFTARLFGVPSIMHLHGSEMKTFYNELSFFGKKLVKYCLEKVEVVVVLSESWKSFILQIAPKSNVKIINNYVNLPAIGNVNHDSTHFNVLFLGVLGQRKGVFDLLACWPSVLEKIPNARLHIGGNGELEKAKALAKQLNIEDSVNFLGWVTGEDKIDLIKNASIFVLPSYNEGLPMSILEAMSWSKPIISTNVGGIPELITHGVEGYLINPGEHELLGRNILALGIDVALRNSMGEMGRKRIVNSFSNQSVLPQLFSIYADIVNDRVGVLRDI